ncbi:MAG: tetratricopeptide repeat protein [Planctomycetes bacterium]|nr:tetratricopeptide repeat protein [Planctomycetota bacterium]
MTAIVWPSALVALLFAIHPTHVESVAWVAERKDVLSTLFALVTILAYVRYTEQPSVRRYLVIIAALAVGLCAKPMLVTLPFILLLLDYWPLNRFKDCKPTLGDHLACTRRLIVEKLPLMLLVILSSVVTLYAQRSGGAVVGAELLSIDSRIGNAMLSYVKYLYMAVWPTGLAVYYSHPFTRPDGVAVIGATLLLGALTVLALAAAKKRPYVAVGWLWYVGTLVPVIGVVQVGSQMLADRYTYVPLIGIFIAVAWTLHSFVTQAHRPSALRKRVVIAIVTVCVAALTVTARAQIGYWRDSVTLFQRALDVTTDNFPAHMFMAQTLYPLGREQEAIEHYETALRINPRAPDTIYNLGYAYHLSGRNAEALARFKEVLRYRPNHANANFHIGRTLVEAGEYRRAIEYSLRALRKDPRFVLAHEHLGWALFELGRFDEAIPHLLQWLEAKPAATATRLRLGQSLIVLGDLPNAVEQLKIVVEQKPDDAELLATLGQALTPLGRVAEAIDAYDKALQLNPEYIEVSNNLARIYATYRDEQFRDGEKAVALAEDICERTNYQSPIILDTLAAAYAEMGRFDEAVTTAKRAVEIARQTVEAAGQLRSLGPMTTPRPPVPQVPLVSQVPQVPLVPARRTPAQRATVPQSPVRRAIAPRRKSSLFSKSALPSTKPASRSANHPSLRQHLHHPNPHRLNPPRPNPNQSSRVRPGRTNPRPGKIQPIYAQPAQGCTIPRRQRRRARRRGPR